MMGCDAGAMPGQPGSRHPADTGRSFSARLCTQVRGLERQRHLPYFGPASGGLKRSGVTSRGGGNQR